MSGGLPPAGWYSDPSWPSRHRWWDGRQWTDQTRAEPATTSWRRWVAGTPLSRRAARYLAWAAGTGTALCAATIGYTAVAATPIPGVGLLLVPGVPLLFAGQLWVIGVMTATRPPEEPGSSARRAFWSYRRIPTRVLLSGLTAWQRLAVVAIFVLSWLSAVTCLLSLPGGSPATARPGCPFPLENHGVVTCVSESRYDEVGATLQRLTASVLLGFFAMHFGVAAGQLAEVRRKDAPDALTG